MLNQCPFVFPNFWVMYWTLPSIRIVFFFYQVINGKGQSVLLVSLEAIFWFLWNQLEESAQAYHISPPAMWENSETQQRMGFRVQLYSTDWYGVVFGLELFKICFKRFHNHPTLCRHLLFFFNAWSGTIYSLDCVDTHGSMLGLRGATPFKKTPDNYQ